MSDGLRIIYTGRRRVAATDGTRVAHVEFSDSGDVAWMEIRRSGTGGPMSGELLLRFDGGGECRPPDADETRLTEFAVDAFAEAQERRSHSPPNASPNSVNVPPCT